MKNKFAFFTLLALAIVSLASCSGARYGAQQRKGYGCPATAGTQNQTAVNKSV